jgi:cytochrome c5
VRPILILLCALAAASSATAQPTYSKEVSRVMQAKCQQCHRPGDIAPFALMTYDDASAWSDDIHRVLTDKIMPPWKPVPGHGDFKGSFGLSDDERQTILDWIAAGTPQGDPADIPDPVIQTGDWQLGDPDLLVQMPLSYNVPRRQDMYRCFVLPTGLDADKWVSAVQVVPGNRQIVHHVILFLDTTGQAQQLDGQDGDPGYTCFGGPGFDITKGIDGLASLLDLTNGLGGWVPGSRIQPLPDGTALFLPKNAKIVMQVHYFPNGHPGPDQTKVGIYYAKTPVSKRMRYIPVVNTTFKIQPGEADKKVTSAFTVPFFLDAHAVQIAPHMHLLGQQIRVELQKRDQDPQDLIYIDNWDFNWQGFYNFTNPVAIPGGSTVKLTCDFNNTTDNPKNPNDPLRVVGWGEGTQDEMCLAFLGVTLDLENLTSVTPKPIQ